MMGRHIKFSRLTRCIMWSVCQSVMRGGAAGAYDVEERERADERLMTRLTRSRRAHICRKESEGRRDGSRQKEGFELMPMHSCENKRIDKGGPSVGDANVNPEGQDTEKSGW